MAKRKAARRAKPTKTGRKSKTRPAKLKASARKRTPARKASKKPAPKPVARRKAVKRPKPRAAAPKKASAVISGKVPRLDRARRTLDERETHDTPPSSLDMDRRASAARTGRAGSAQRAREHHGMSGVTGGDPDVDVEDAYFTGEEAPGGDNPTPDQDIVEEIGKALGVTYNDNEELKGADKLVERDKHRWELNPASSEDFAEHDKD